MEKSEILQLRFAAMQLEKVDLLLAKNLLSIASKFAPNDRMLAMKLSDYEYMLKKSGKSKFNTSEEIIENAKKRKEIEQEREKQFLIDELGVVYKDYEILSNRISDNYSIKINRNKSKNLVIVMSAFNNFMLKNYQLKYDSLYIYDKKNSYYIADIKDTINAIYEFISKNHYQDIIFVGTSKSGYGALLWKHLLSKKGLDNLYSITINPFTKLFPINLVQFKTKSYRQLIDLYYTNIDIKNALNEYGDLKTLITKKDSKSLLIYSANSYEDTHEFLNISSKVIPYPINFSDHTLLPFLTLNASINENNGIEEVVNRIYQRAETDLDLKAALPEDKNKYIQQCHANTQQLDEIIYKFHSSAL